MKKYASKQRRELLNYRLNAVCWNIVGKHNIEIEKSFILKKI